MPEPRGAAAVEPGGGSAAQDAEAAARDELSGSSATDARDAEVFGPTGPAGAANDGSPTQQGERDLFDEIEQAAEHSTIGAFLFLRLDLHHVEHTRLRDSQLLAPGLLDVYFDAGITDDVRSYARGRLDYDLVLRLAVVRLDQLWVKFDLAELVYFTVGQQPIRWGVGRFFNPTDFLHPQIRDPLAVFDERTGVPLLRAHVPVESLDLNIYGIVNLYDAIEPDQLGAALRGEMLVGAAEISLTGALRRGTSQIGIDASLGLGPFELRAEGAASHNAIALPCGANPLETRAPPREDWIVQGTANVELHVPYGYGDHWVVGVEYFYNQAGCPDADAYLAFLLQELYQPLRLGEHYAAAYSQLAAPGDWNESVFVLSLLSNLSDQSAMARLDYSYSVSSRLIFNAFVTYGFGERGEFHLRLEAPPEVASAAERAAEPDGPITGPLRVEAPLFSAGVGVRTTF
jgi:hypothetical protein